MSHDLRHDSNLRFRDRETTLSALLRKEPFKFGLLDACLFLETFPQLRRI